VRLFNELGSERVIQTARSLGVTSPLPEGDPSLALGTSTTTLLELTSAYAGVAANRLAVKPYAFAPEKAEWWDWFDPEPGQLDAQTHANIEAMLRRAINRGTGRAAMLPIANFGKTGTTQDSRDAVFVGYAGEDEDTLVLGVWVGNDDNSSLGDVTGGGLPARIWRDFMRGALSLGPAPRRNVAPDPTGPVQPLDVEEGAVIDLDDNGSQLRFDEEGVTLSTQADGVSLRLRLDQDGLRFEELSKPTRP